MTEVFFDCRYIRVDHHDGISRFSVGLFNALHEHVPLVAIYSDERQLQHLPVGVRAVQLPDPTHWSEPLAALRLNQLGAKVVYSPMQTIGTLGRRFKLVLTLHDLIYYNHPTPPPSMPFSVRVGWRVFHFWYWPQRLLLNSADAVVTVSETSKRLMAKHRLTRKPIHVVYNAGGDLPEGYEHRMPGHRPRDTQRLIYMGSFMRYKNVELLMRAMNALPEYELHLCSRISEERQLELAALLEPCAGKVFFHNGISEDTYHRLLDEAVALVSASRDEGFGIPLIEAMARGIPVLASDIEIFHEIGGDAALYFNPESPADLVAKLEQIESETSWLERSALAVEQAGKFSWAGSAAALQRVLQNL